jgi:hypothetical protein
MGKMKKKRLRFKKDEKAIDDYIEEVGIFVDKLPEGSRVYLEGKWYKATVKGPKIIAVVKDGECFRMVNDSCHICGKHAHIGGGHLFVGKPISKQLPFYVDRHGWFCDKEAGRWICPECFDKIIDEKISKEGGEENGKKEV